MILYVYFNTHQDNNILLGYELCMIRILLGYELCMIIDDQSTNYTQPGTDLFLTEKHGGPIGPKVEFAVHVRSICMLRPARSGDPSAGESNMGYNGWWWLEHDWIMIFHMLGMS